MRTNLSKIASTLALLCAAAFAQQSSKAAATSVADTKRFNLFHQPQE